MPRSTSLRSAVRSRKPATSWPITRLDTHHPHPPTPYNPREEDVMTTGTPVTGARPAVPARTVELSIGGMTCASCAARIEKKLNRIDGVAANVNLATEKATVVLTDAVAPEKLIATIEATGYTAALPQPAQTTAGTPTGRTAEAEL